MHGQQKGGLGKRKTRNKLINQVENEEERDLPTAGLWMPVNGSEAKLQSQIPRMLQGALLKSPSGLYP